MQPSGQSMPPQAQQMINELQQQKQQLQQMAEQKNLLEARKRQVEEALDALDDVDGDKEVFRVVGPVGIKTEQDDLTENLSDEKEKLGVQLESVESKQEDLEEEAKEKQQKIQEMMSGGQQAGKSS